MPKVTAVVVGAGLAGLSAAYSLARDGIDVLVVERGDYPGAKNITGGRLYFRPIMELYPELWPQAPWERHVVKEILTLVGERSSTSLELDNQDYNVPPYHSFTILASRFNKWFARQAAGKGARIISKYKVDDLIKEAGKIKGVIVGGAKIEADVVVAADGGMSQIAQKAGLKGRLPPQDYALGVKEVIALSPEKIESRFGLKNGEGTARLFVGAVSRGIMGGGFLYTNADSLSLGVVISIKGLSDYPGRAAPYQFLEELKRRPEVAPLIAGGESMEYSAHILSESGIKGMPKLYGDGILVAGDAAGMLLNTGLTVRGMEFAIASGAMAADTVKVAKKQNDFSAAALGKYDDMIKGSFIWKELTAFKHAPEILANPRLFARYPRVICRIMQELMTVDGTPRQKLSTTVIKNLRKESLSLVRDFFSLRRM